MGGTWSLADLPDQTDRTILVTGTTLGGLGYYTALELARAGGRVILAGRNPEKLGDARASLEAQLESSDFEELRVDLASLDSVREAAAAAARFGPIDVLVNNAGVMAPDYARTPDGFELQMATNHFGPFLFTGLLLPSLVASGDARVVTVSSQMHRLAFKAPLGDPRVQEGRYLRWPEYSRSKLANLLFTFELDRRASAAGLPVKALAAHPGYAGTHLVANGRFGRSAGGAASILDAANRAIAQPADAGAWPLLMAATADLPGSTYCGPGGFAQAGGAPKVVGTTKLARSRSAQRDLWELSKRAVDLSYP
jgi:NAD(P)-dependent dehydrogenase (short-subunit alcohol dehydrogenase family)